MKVTMVDAMSINGHITRGNEQQVQAWTSPEDGRQFRQQLAASDAVVMGSTTYEAMKPQPEASKLRVVMTRRVAEFAGQTIAGQLEFSDASPELICDDLQKRGYQQVMVAGGAAANAAFLQAGVVDELRVTVEPKLFGSGTPLAQDFLTADIACRLIEVEHLNAQGTLLLRYAVLKPEMP